MNEKNRLVLAVKPNERFELRDEVSGLSVGIRVFYRQENGDLAVAFEAPQRVRISRNRWSGNGDRETD